MDLKLLMGATQALLAQALPESTFPAGPALFAGQHYATPDRKAWRRLKREKGFRQARLERNAARRLTKETA